MSFFVNSTLCNRTIDIYVQNLTSLYTHGRNDTTMVATSVFMFILAVLFFNLNLFSRLYDISSTLNPSIRFVLSLALSLFVPAMSYLFSEAKNQDGPTSGSGQSTEELPLQARMILMWMLLVELLRKKVEAILRMPEYSSIFERAARSIWLGMLVNVNVHGAGRKTTYGIVWALGAAKLVQRVVISEIGRRSFAYGKNAELLTSYMGQLLQGRETETQGPSGSELLEECKFVVMGEENLVNEEEQRTYHLQLNEATVTADGYSAVVTVGEVWKLKDLQEDAKRLCLSLALFKLLRPRLEGWPISDLETRECRRLIFEGLCICGEVEVEAGEGEVEVEVEGEVEVEVEAGEAKAAALFQVLEDEMQFLSEYYHSVHPVVFASRFFFLANYILYPITVWGFCALTFVLSNNGDMAYARRSITGDNYTMSVGLLRVAGCLLSRITKHVPALFATIQVAITILLAVCFIYEEVWEFLVFVFSKWLTVSLICDYTVKLRRPRTSPILRGVIQHIMSVRSINRMMSHPSLRVKHFSVMRMWFFRLRVPNKAVPEEAKKSIMEYLLRHVRKSRPLSNGLSALAEHRPDLSWACESESVAEVILTWHIATTLLESKHPKKKKIPLPANRVVATALSGYCAYLVAQHPELLPDDKPGTERVYKAMKKDLKVALGGCWWYHFSPERARCNRVLLAAGDMDLDHATTAMTVVQKGALLGKRLNNKRREEETNDHEATMWKLLADLWTELMVYVAPPTGEAHLKAHEEALARGGEFVTVLCALTMHSGITRPVIKPWESVPVEHADDHAV